MERPTVRRLEHGIPEIVRKLMHENVLRDHPRKVRSDIDFETMSDELALMIEANPELLFEPLDEPQAELVPVPNQLIPELDINAPTPNTPAQGPNIPIAISIRNVAIFVENEWVYVLFTEKKKTGRSDYWKYLFRAQVIGIVRGANEMKYKVHYYGWDPNKDETLSANELLKITTDTMEEFMKSRALRKEDKRYFSPEWLLTQLGVVHALVNPVNLEIPSGGVTRRLSLSAPNSARSDSTTTSVQTTTNTNVPIVSAPKRGRPAKTKNPGHDNEVPSTSRAQPEIAPPATSTTATKTTTQKSNT